MDNGLGDRVQGTVNGITTNFVLDLNSGLTQVLQDGAYTYLYGTDRIAQYGVLPGRRFGFCAVDGRLERSGDSGEEL